MLSIFTNLGILFSFKYFNFVNDSLRALCGAVQIEYSVPDLDVLLPMGISFYTFQTLAYTIDVYRGRLAPASHLGKFALYVTFFPQLVAGPIERAQSLLPQFDQYFDFDTTRIQSGLKQMLWGFFKKLVVADRVAVLVDMVYNTPAQHDGSVLLLATYLFALQIYCDFSGYSDIAIGAAKVLGFDLMENFRTPYLSGSIREFWSRWHISLSTWFRDYLYIPLGGNRVGKWRWYYNLFVVFLISGLWHGANWTFILWGALHGAYLVLAVLFTGFWKRVERLLRLNNAPGFKRVVNVAITFHLAVFAWIFFRANSMNDAFVVLENIVEWRSGAQGLMDLFQEIGFGIVAVTIVFAAVFFLLDPILDKVVKQEVRLKRPASVFLFATVLACTLIFGHFGETQFIYFQF